MLFQLTIDMSDLTGLLWLIVSFLIFLLLLAIVLKIALGFVKSKHDDFGEVFVTALIIVLVVAVVSFILQPLYALIIGLLLMWLIISSRHDTGFVTAIGVSVAALIVAIILLILIGIVLGTIGITIVSFF